MNDPEEIGWALPVGFVIINIIALVLINRYQKNHLSLERKKNVMNTAIRMFHRKIKND